MNAKIQILAASAIACLTSGCIVADPYYNDPVVYGRPVAMDSREEIILPSVLIVEGGVRHDRAFYHRHPEYYRRDRMRYPHLFRPESHHDRGPVVVAPVYRAESRHDRGPVVVAPAFHGPVAAPHGVARPNGPGNPGDQHPQQNDPKAKKKHRDDKDHDDHNR